ncbi:MAG: baseplate J/gp47 family protein [Burkholderiales bacterium]
MALTVLDSNGLLVEDYVAFLDALKEAYRGIYGQDLYLEPDSQDGQWLAIKAQTDYDTARLAQAVYCSFSPLTAIGDALSRNVRLNGIKRLIPSFSTVDLTVTGTVGTVILNGQARDSTQQNWNLPASVTIPIGGTITVTATAVEIGAIFAAVGTITTIATPTLGWLSVTNLTAATPGEPVETDAQLRIRQKQSVALPSQTVLDGLVGDIAGIPDVIRAKAYENDSGVTDINGVPPHSIALVVDGGDAQEIGDRIHLRKTLGTGTFGEVVIQSLDSKGLPTVVRFFRPAVVTIKVSVIIQILFGFQSTLIANIQDAVSAYLRSLDIGEDVILTKLFCPSEIPPPAGNTYIVQQILIRRATESVFGNVDLEIDFIEAATALSADVSVNAL